MYRILVVAFGLFMVNSVYARDEIKGIRPSYGSGVKVVPIDIEQIDIHYTFDVESKKSYRRR